MKKIISIILLAVIISTSVLFTGCGGEVAPSNAQTSDEVNTTALVEPSYVLLLSYLKDTSHDIWVLIYVKGDDVYVQADKRHANINLDTAGYDIYKSKYNKSQLEELIK